MTIATFKKAIEWEEYVTLGGGEPTLHPKFWEILGVALGHAESVYLVTNGSVTETALTLASLAKRGVIGCALSQDDFHDPIDGRVIQAFTKDKTPRDSFLAVPGSMDQREIRNTTYDQEPHMAGRCDWGTLSCACSDLIVKPSGIVHACACDDAPTFGNINDEWSVPEGWMVGECWKYNDEEGVLDLEQYA